ncbi:hypothetical protein GCM10027280_62280 [Micromonospora polyrhachis]|uniref:Uncharacterized protein n=1 Tax=Micromonospora polyrhachis TaxID=1282883 RepID=A0A7W7SRC9_9ACTN|nr:hypothetical protein [Micromonospora polyrhachis]MBB4958872.1 hypothetical protein [Micromonospora polyrhachis]
MAADGQDLVDLTVEWTSKDLNGEQENFSVPPEKPESDGNGGWVNDEGEPVDKDGYPLPPEPPKPDKEGDPPPDPLRPDEAAFAVAPGEIHDYQVAIMGEVETQITDFEAMRDRVMKDEDWIFWAPNANPTKHVSAVSGKGGNEMGRNIAYDVKEKDPNPEQTAEIITGHHQLLQSVGGVIHLVGTAMGVFNDVGQIYAGADRGAWIDEPEWWIEGID